MPSHLLYRVRLRGILGQEVDSYPLVPRRQVCPLPAVVVTELVNRTAELRTQGCQAGWASSIELVPGWAQRGRHTRAYRGGRAVNDLPGPVIISAAENDPSRGRCPGTPPWRGEPAKESFQASLHLGGVTLSVNRFRRQCDEPRSRDRGYQARAEREAVDGVLLGDGSNSIGRGGGTGVARRGSVQQLSRAGLRLDRNG
jgi:hypothetical protein